MKMKKSDSSQLIIADIPALDKYSFDITVNFERLLERHIPALNIRDWGYAVACDGHFDPAKDTDIILLRGKDEPEILKNADLVDSEYTCREIKFNMQLSAAGGTDSIPAYIAKLGEMYPALKFLACLPPPDMTDLVAFSLRDIQDIRSTIFSDTAPACGGVMWQPVSPSVCFALGITDDEIRKINHTI